MLVTRQTSDDAGNGHVGEVLRLAWQLRQAQDGAEGSEDWPGMEDWEQSVHKCLQETGGCTAGLRTNWAEKRLLCCVAINKCDMKPRVS